MLLALSLFPIAGCALLWTILSNRYLAQVWEYLLVVACFLYIPLIFVLNCYRAHRFGMKRGPYHYRVDEDGVHVTTRFSELTQHWAAISRVRQRNGIVFLYFTKRSAHCIPVRALPASDCVALIETLARAAGVPRVGT